MIAYPETNLGLPPGDTELSNIPFEIGWKASTQCSHLPKRPEQIQLNTNVPKPVSVHLLLQAGGGYTSYRGKRVGNIRLGFSDRSSYETPLTLGINIRDWSRSKPDAVTNLISLSKQDVKSEWRIESAWEGKPYKDLQGKPSGDLGGIDMLTINIPKDKSHLTLKRIEISDESRSTTKNIDPCIHLIAVTVKYLQ